MSAKRGKFWRLSDLATAFECSQSSVVSVCKIMGKAIVGNQVWFAAPARRPTRPFIEEVYRISEMDKRQAQLREARHAGIPKN